MGPMAAGDIGGSPLPAMAANDSMRQRDSVLMRSSGTAPVASVCRLCIQLPMDFLWDEAKRIANLAKPGVDFADAIGALLDPYSLTLEDADAGGETRFVTLGEDVHGSVLLVAWTERDHDTIRIISAGPVRAKRAHTASAEP